MKEKLRVLVADDDESIRGILTQVLEEDGYALTTATSGEEALELFRKSPFPLLITDIRMGGMSGIELLENVRKTHPETEVIIITSYASLETAIVALRAGAYDYLLKPFEELDLLNSVVNRAAEKIRLTRDNRYLVEQLRKKNEELESVNDLLRNLASQDGLTGLFNHRHFHECLSAELSRSGRHHHSFTLVFLDVDNFKNYNDLNGHLSGDTVLRDIGKILKTSLRGSDISARYGGEEFVILLPETSKQDGKFVAEKIRGLIESFPFHGREKQPLQKITVSAGVAAFPEDGKDSTALLDYADKALYRAKDKGKNTVCTQP